MHFESCPHADPEFGAEFVLIGRVYRTKVSGVRCRLCGAEFTWDTIAGMLRGIDPKNIAQLRKTGLD